MIAMGGAIGVGLFLGSSTGDRVGWTGHYSELSRSRRRSSNSRLRRSRDGGGRAVSRLFWPPCRTLRESLERLCRACDVQHHPNHCHWRRSYGHGYLFSLLVPDESAVALGGHRFFRPDRFQRLAEFPVRLRMFPLSNILGILLVPGIAGTSFYVKDLEYSVPVFLALLSAVTLVYWGSRRRFPGHPRANQGGRSSVPEP